MNRRICYFVMAILQILTWYSATSRPFYGASQQDRIPQLSEAAFDVEQGLKNIDGEVYGNRKTDRGLSRLGSRPPNCAHRCQGCIPCDAIQIPETANHKGLLYANYEPEGWKCKCGASFYNP